MNSFLYTGHLMHRRLRPQPHEFTYRVFGLGLDLDELPQLDARVRGFGVNRFRPASIREGDYLDGEPGGIRATLRRRLAQWGVSDDIGRMVLITSPRWMNYAFNPVNFYYVFRPDGRLRCAVAEVNNTFGDRHLYPLVQPDGDDRFPLHYTCPKDFHVSPFNNLAGTYRFSFSALDGALDIGIDLERDGAEVLQTRITGHMVPLTSAALARSLVRFPLNTALTMPRILGQAAALYFRKKLPVFGRPQPTSPATIKTRPQSTPSAWARLLKPTTAQSKDPAP